MLKERMLPVLSKNKILFDAEVKSTHHRCCRHPTIPLSLLTQADEQLNKGTKVPPYPAAQQAGGQANH